MEFDHILIEDPNGNEKVYTLYDKIVFNNQNIFVFYNEEKYNDINLFFLKYDPSDNSLTEDIHDYDCLLMFYKHLDF